MSIFTVVSRNILRRPLRSVPVFLGMAALSGTLFALTTLYFSVERGVEKGRTRLGADAMAVPLMRHEETAAILISGEPSEFYMPGDFKERLSAMKGVSRASAQLFIISAPLACCAVSDTMLIGFEPGSDFTISPWLKERLQRELSPEEVIIGSSIRAEPGGRTMFYGKEFTIAGKLEPTGMKFLDGSVFIPMEGARQMIAQSGEKALKTLGIRPDEISAVLLKFDENASHEETAARIEYAMPQLKVVLSSDVLKSARRNLAVPLKAAMAGAVIQWAVSLFLIGVFYRLSIGQRVKEIGLLKAMGAKGRDVRNIFLYEVILLSAGGGVTGAVFGAVLIESFENLLRVFFDAPLLLPSFGLGLALAALVVAFTVISGLAATLLPVLKTAGKSPYDAIRQGE